MRKASLAQLVVIRYNDPMATFADKIAAEIEIIRRQRKQRSSKPTRVTNRMAFRR